MELAQILADGKDWDLFPTSVAGLYVQKMPPTKNLPTRLAVKINPIGPNGMPSKRHGYTIRSAWEIDALRKVANAEEVEKLLGMLEGVSGVPVAPGGATTIIEI